MHWWTDLRHAARSLRRAPGFVAIAVGTLGLAVGANTGIFSVIDTVLLHSLPYHPMDRLVGIGGIIPDMDMPKQDGISAELYLLYQKSADRLADVATYNGPFTSSFRAGDRVERLRMSSPSYNLFRTLGARPVIGRLPVAADQDHVALISWSLWQSWFGGDPSVIGRSYEVSGAQRTIIGVMPKDFGFPTDGTLIWFPEDITTTGLVPGQFGLNMVARLKPGVSMESAVQQLTTLARRAPEEFAGSPGYAREMAGYRATIEPLRTTMLGDVSKYLWLMVGAVAIVLLVAWVNVANLFAVRAEGRLHDLTVRRALGARAGDLVRLQVIEALLVAVGAAIVAVALAAVALPVFVHAAPPDIPRIATVHLNLESLGYTAALAVITALVCGLAPAVRTLPLNFTRLREEGRGSTGKRSRARDLLVAGQTALALVLLIGSALLIRSFVNISHVHPGYDTHNIFTFQIAPERPSLHDGPTWGRFQLGFMERLRALPGVESVGEVDNVPLDEGTETAQARADSGAANLHAARLHTTFSAGDYFKTMHIAVLRGHPFTDAEAMTPGEVVVSKAAAKVMWPGQDPIGRRLQLEGDTTWMTVTGEVDDVLQENFREPAEPVIYLPLVGATPTEWSVSSPAVVIRTRRAATIAPEVRALVHEVAPEAPMYRVFTMEQLTQRSFAALSFMLLILGVAAFLTLILGAVGLYGVLSHVVALRRREIGVRMALGAQASNVRSMVVRQGIIVVGSGIVAGVIVAMATGRALGSLLFGVSSIDPVTYIAMPAMLLVVALIASYIPAWRASSIDPIEALRN